MHNLKEIRKDFNSFKKSLEKRSIEINISNLEKLDKKNRELIQKKESLEQEKQEISKSKDKSLFEKSKKLSQDIDEITKEQKNIKIELESILSNIRSLFHSSFTLFSFFEADIIRSSILFSNTSSFFHFLLFPIIASTSKGDFLFSNLGIFLSVTNISIFALFLFAKNNLPFKTFESLKNKVEFFGR